MLGVMARGRCWRGGGRAAAGATRARWREHKVVKWCTPLCLSRVARALFGLRFASLFAQRCALSVGRGGSCEVVFRAVSNALFVFPAHARRTVSVIQGPTTHIPLRRPTFIRNSSSYIILEMLEIRESRVHATFQAIDVSFYFSCVTHTHLQCSTQATVTSHYLKLCSSSSAAARTTPPIYPAAPPRGGNQRACPRAPLRAGSSRKPPAPTPIWVGVGVGVGVGQGKGEG